MTLCRVLCNTVRQFIALHGISKVFAGLFPDLTLNGKLTQTRPPLSLPFIQVVLPFVHLVFVL